MFFGDPPTAFANLARSLRSGGRIAFLAWQDLAVNDWAMVPALAALQHVPLPELDDTTQTQAFSLADPDHTTALLHQAGFTDIVLDPVTAPLWLGASVNDAVRYLQHADLAHTLFTAIPEDTAAAGWAAVTDALRPHAGDEGVELPGAAWLITGRTPS